MMYTSLLSSLTSHHIISNAGNFAASMSRKNLRKPIYDMQLFFLLIHIYELLIRIYELVIRNYELVFRIYEILIRKYELVKIFACHK